MKSFNFIFAAAAFALAACASITPAFIHLDRTSQIVEGKTTMAEVGQLMGRANDVVVNKRTQQRVYEYDYKDVWGYPARLNLVYDDRGVVASKSTESVDRD